MFQPIHTASELFRLRGSSSSGESPPLRGHQSATASKSLRPAGSGSDPLAPARAAKHHHIRTTFLIEWMIQTAGELTSEPLGMTGRLRTSAPPWCFQQWSLHCYSVASGHVEKSLRHVGINKHNVQCAFARDHIREAAPAVIYGRFRQQSSIGTPSTGGRSHCRLWKSAFGGAHWRRASSTGVPGNSSAHILKRDVEEIFDQVRAERLAPTPVHQSPLEQRQAQPGRGDGHPPSRQAYLPSTDVVGETFHCVFLLFCFWLWCSFWLWGPCPLCVVVCPGRWAYRACRLSFLGFSLFCSQDTR